MMHTSLPNEAWQGMPAAAYPAPDRSKFANFQRAYTLSIPSHDPYRVRNEYHQENQFQTIPYTTSFNQSNCSDFHEILAVPNLHSRPPRRKAVIVGVCYTNSDGFHLEGSANDAIVFAETLVHTLFFNRQDIILLVDAVPSACYQSPEITLPTQESGNETDSIPQIPKSTIFKSIFKRSTFSSFFSHTEAQKQADLNSSNYNASEKIDIKYIERAASHNCSSMWPTRQNILRALNWLVRDSQANDMFIFYFSGHGIQVDNMAGWEGEGYDEAILPCDYYHGRKNNLNVLTTVQLRELLLNIDRQAQMTIVLDCCGGQTILDPAGTISGFGYIKGVKQKGFWPFLTDPTDKVARAKYNPEVWMHSDMSQQMTRPKYLPGIEIDSTAALKDPCLQQAGSTASSTKGYCICAAPWGQCASEAVFLSLTIISRDTGLPLTTPNYPVIHGVLTYCFVKALQEIAKGGNIHSGGYRIGVSFKRVMSRILKEIEKVKMRLTRLDQVPELTIYTAGDAKITELFAVPSSFRQNHPIQVHRADEQHYLNLSDAWQELRLKAVQKAAVGVDPITSVLIPSIANPNPVHRMGYINQHRNTFHNGYNNRNLYF